MTFLDDVIKRVRDWDASRPRSLQAEPGWSEVGGCRSALGFRLARAWESDEPDNWGAIRGTAIHQLLEDILRDEPGFRTEVTTSYRGIPGHADLLTIEEGAVTDWKTTRLANVLLWSSSKEALWEKRVQVHGYAASLVDSGELREDAIVRLVAIPVDGKFADWWVFEEPFDRSIADWGADRLEWVRERQAAGDPLPKDKPATFCEAWCPFFTQCRVPGGEADGEVITDPETVAAVAAYDTARSEETAAKKRKEALAPLVRGLRGIAGDFRVGMSKAGEPKTALDEDWIRADYAARGEPVPEVTVPGSAPRLNITRLKKKAAA